MRLLVLNSEIPFPPITGAQSRTYHLLRELSTEHELTLVGFGPEVSHTSTIYPFPVEVITVPWVLPELYRKMYGDNSSESQAAYLHLEYESDEPWFVSYYESPAMDEVLSTMRLRSFYLILIENSFMARFLSSLPLGVPKILDMHNVHTLMAWRRAQEKSGSDKDDAVKEFDRTRSFERRVSSACQLCLCCSEQDAGAARHFLNVEHVTVIPNGVDTAVMTPPGAPSAMPGYLLFTGMMNYEPNIEAVRYFATDIFPFIQHEVPHATFHIVGANPAPEVRALACDAVFIHGSVPDMRPYFYHASIVVVPLLHGGGTRLKILDAAACAKPIVSTPAGAEGLNLLDGRDILLANSASEFVQAVVRLSSDRLLQCQLSQCARLASEAYDWSKITSRFCSVLACIAQRISTVATSMESRHECADD